MCSLIQLLDFKRVNVNRDIIYFSLVGYLGPPASVGMLDDRLIPPFLCATHVIRALLVRRRGPRVAIQLLAVG